MECRCNLCKISFASEPDLQAHIQGIENHSESSSGCTCDGCKPAMGPHRVFFYGRSLPCNIHCEACDVWLYMCKKGMRNHKARKSHKKHVLTKDIVCADSGEYFLTKWQYDIHVEKLHKTTTQYRCIECSSDFQTQCALKSHAKNDSLHEKCRIRLFCGPCEAGFKKWGSYNIHLLSKIHRMNTGTNCLTYPLCTRKFTTKAGMIAHLESGACPSKFNRYKIEEIIRRHDVTNIVVQKNIEATPQLPPPPPPVPNLIEYAEQEYDSDSDGGCTIILTPPTTTPSVSRRESFGLISVANFTPSSSGLSTPASGAVGFSGAELELAFGRVCYICGREFGSARALESHMNSLARAPMKYHCPTFLFELPVGVKKPRREFKSLSGLVAHLESGACQGGGETLESAIAFVEEKLNAMRGLELAKVLLLK